MVRESVGEEGKGREGKRRAWWKGWLPIGWWSAGDGEG